MEEPASLDLGELRRKFEACDENGDGRIDGAEFQALLQALDGDVSLEEGQLDFLVIDEDEDGSISFEEFSAWWTG